MKLTTIKKVRRIDADPNYLVFGSGELKLKARTLHFESNIGGFMCEYFWNGRATSNSEFLNSEDGKVGIKGY